MKKYYKLIRDNIPNIIKEDNGNPKIRTLNIDEFKTELLKKLIEESQEAIEARGDRKELTKELGDVIEVIDYIIEVFGLDKKEVEKVRKERKSSRGGFDKRLFLEYVK